MPQRCPHPFAPLLLVAVLAAAATTPAAAGTRFSAFAARWDRGAAGAAFGGGVRVGVPVGERLTLDLRASVYERGTDGLRAVPLDLGLRLDLARRDILNPYLGAGATYVRLDADAGIGRGVDDEVGWYVLAGVELGKFFLEGDYRRIDATVGPGRIQGGDVGGPGPRADVDLSGIALHAGWIWKF